MRRCQSHLQEMCYTCHATTDCKMLTRRRALRRYQAALLLPQALQPCRHRLEMTPNPKAVGRSTSTAFPKGVWLWNGSLTCWKMAKPPTGRAENISQSMLLTNLADSDLQRWRFYWWLTNAEIKFNSNLLKNGHDKCYTSFCLFCLKDFYGIPGQGYLSGSPHDWVHICTALQQSPRDG